MFPNIKLQNRSLLRCLRNEVNTHQLIKDTLETGRRVIVPVIDLSSHTLLNSEIKSFDELKKGTIRCRRELTLFSEKCVYRFSD